jgi:Predicted permeases
MGLLPALEPWQWLMLGLATVLIGAAKTGFAGIGIVSIALFALVWPARESVGIVLVILICADCVAISAYRRQLARWDILRQIYPWSLLGVALGYLALGRVSDTDAKRLIGATLLLLVLLSLAQRLRARPVPAAAEGAAPPPPQDEGRVPLWITAVAGTVAGATTMVANAAGPVMVLYLLTRRLDKVSFVATAAWYFFTLNLCKVPFGLQLGLINGQSLLIALALLPTVLLGGIVGKWALPRVNQKAFEYLALGLTFAASLRLLF